MDSISEIICPCKLILQIFPGCEFVTCGRILAFCSYGIQQNQLEISSGFLRAYDLDRRMETHEHQ